MLILKITSVDLLQTIAVSHLFAEGAITAEEYCKTTSDEVEVDDAKDFLRMIFEAKQQAMHRIAAGRN